MISVDLQTTPESGASAMVDHTIMIMYNSVCRLMRKVYYGVVVIPTEVYGEFVHIDSINL